MSVAGRRLFRQVAVPPAIEGMSEIWPRSRRSTQMRVVKIRRKSRGGMADIRAETPNPWVSSVGFYPLMQSVIPDGTHADRRPKPQKGYQADLYM
jgi:hypothetical protein